MQPVARGHTALANVPAAQNFLTDKRDHYGVINIVICGVAGCDIFKSKLGDKTDDPRIAGLQRPVCSFVHRPKLADEGFYDYQCGVEHANQPRCPNGPKLITRVTSKEFGKGAEATAGLEAI